nr:zinc finger, CCHC-type [Tanacetum cinerariifolium]
MKWPEMNVPKEVETDAIRATMFYVWILSGYEECRITRAEEKKAEIKKTVEQLILSDARQMVWEMQAFNKQLEETIGYYCTPLLGQNPSKPGKLTTLANKAASLGHTFEDPTLLRKLLNDVPEKFLQIVASIEQYSDLDEISVEEAIRRLKTFKERIKVKKGKAFEDQDKLLFAKHNDNGQRHHYDNQGGGRYIPPHN